MSVYQPKYRDPKTKELRKSPTWWYEFIYQGRRIRESAETTRKTIAIEAEKRRRLELERAAAGLPVEDPGRRISDVKTVLKQYQDDYTLGHRPKSIAWVKQRSEPVEELLGNFLLPDLTEARIREYMRKRLEAGMGNRTINMELSILSRALGRTWRALWPKVKKLEEPSDIGRALESDEEKAILGAAAANRSPLIYPFLIALAWTGMRSEEASTLQWFQVDWEANEVRVGQSKTEAGKGRTIPMGAPLRAALEQHAAAMAKLFGPLKPDWYVFPFCNTVKPVDPTRPITSFKTAWDSVRTSTKVQCRLHDSRHSFCTKLAEAGVPESTMLDMMGHVSPSMLRRYSHIRAKARREAIAALETRSASVGVPKESPKVDVVSRAKKPVSH
ncbi:MAG: site-specific integrase [Bryobacterales bacterium]|nr:site-specific integrase [Bryobacterales bacterium]